MVRLDYIHHEFLDASIGEQGELVWKKRRKTPIDRLPQIFWANGRAWAEANVWAETRAASGEVDIQTIEKLMKHLARYAHYLEVQGVDWRHFPVRKSERVLAKFRKHLMDAVDDGVLANSTASNRMNAVIQFYRFADSHNLVQPEAPMWTDRLAVIPFHDAAGFKRTIVRLSTDLRIPNRGREGTQLEDGLLPLIPGHMTQLLAYTAERASEELYRMLSIGFFTGARAGTVTTFTVTCLQTAREDPMTPGVYLVPVGPPTEITTKFSVSGSLRIPKDVLDDLNRYAFSTRRLKREAKARPEDKNRLFLTRNGRPYTVGTLNRLVWEMRTRAVSDGLKFLRRFRFHQSRATFGTWLTKLLLDNKVPVTAAISFVKECMFHLHERTTMGYITFLENTEAKQQAAAAFNKAFTGLQNRNWDRADA